MEDQKELPSTAVNPELRQKEVQMNFFNQLTSVFNPDLTTILASPSSAHTQARIHPTHSYLYLHFPHSSKLSSLIWNLSSNFRLKVSATTKPQIRLFRPKWKMPLYLRMCQAYRNLVSKPCGAVIGFSCSFFTALCNTLFFFIYKGGSEKLLRVCLNLPYFLRYINRFQDAVSANSFFIMPATVADATAVRNG